MGKAKKRRSKADIKQIKKELPIEQLAEIGEQLMDDGNYVEAKKYFVKSLQDEVNAHVLFALASCLLELNEPNEAREHLIRACDLEPETGADKFLTLAELEDGRSSLECLNKGAALTSKELADFEAQGGPNPAGDINVKINSTRRKLSNIHVCISELYTTDLCDEPNAEESVVNAIKTALEIDPQNPDAIQAKASYHLIKNEFDQAKVEMHKSLNLWLTCFDKIVEGNEPTADEDASMIPTFNVRLASVKLLMELDMLDEAILVLDGLALEDEECVDVWYLLGWANYLMGEDYHSNAKYYLKKACKIGKRHDVNDAEMLSHVDELLAELQGIETDEDDNGDDDGAAKTDNEDWTTDED